MLLFCWLLTVSYLFGRRVGSGVGSGRGGVGCGVVGWVGGGSPWLVGYQLGFQQSGVTQTLPTNTRESASSSSGGSLISVFSSS